MAESREVTLGKTRKTNPAGHKLRHAASRAAMIRPSRHSKGVERPIDVDECLTGGRTSMSLSLGRELWEPAEVVPDGKRQHQVLGDKLHDQVFKLGAVI